MKIHTRTSWGARPAHATQERHRERQSPRQVHEFFIHWPGEDGKFTGIPESRERAILREFQNFHMDTREWADFAYSFAVFQSGRVYRGRGMDFVPAGQENHNTGTMAVVCVVGPHDEPSRYLIRSVKDLKHFAEKRAGHRLTVRPHKAVVQTTCPGPKLSALIPEFARA